MIRRQLPAYSPLRLGHLTRAALGTMHSPDRLRAELESYLSRRFGANEVVLTGSGTQALQAALSIAGSLSPWAGRPVALPAYSCYDVVTAAVGAAVPVLFYDVDPLRLAPSRESVAHAVRSGVGTFVAANLYGFPIDWSWLRQVAKDNRILLVEDAAQGIGSRWEGREGGSFGDLTVLSFGRGKGWTGGGGGALLWRLDHAGSTSVRATVRGNPSGTRASLRTALVSVAQWGLGRPSVYRVPTSLPWLALGETRYKDPSPLCEMNGFAAAATLAHKALAEAEIEGRKQRAARLRQLWPDASSANDVSPCEPLSGGESGYLRFPVLAAPSEAEQMARNGRDLGIGRGYPKSLVQLPAAQGILAEGQAPTPGAEELASSLVTLPTHSMLSEADLARCVEFVSGSPWVA